MNFKKNVDLIFFGIFVLLSTIAIGFANQVAFGGIVWGWILMTFAGFLCWRKGYIKFNFKFKKGKKNAKGKKGKRKKR